MKEGSLKKKVDLERRLRGFQRRSFTISAMPQAGERKRRCAYCRDNADEDEEEKEEEDRSEDEDEDEKEKEEEDRSGGDDEDEDEKEEDERSGGDDEDEDEKEEKKRRRGRAKSRALEDEDEEEKEEEGRSIWEDEDEDEEEKEEEDRSFDEEDKDEEEEDEEKKKARMIVEGYATTFDVPYQLFRLDGVAVFERVDSRAFDGADMRDVIFQYDHEGRVFARMSNGTLKVSVDARGLRVRADLSGTAEGRKLYREIKGGYTTKMSFAFTIDEDEIEELPEEEVLGFRTGSTDVYILHTIKRIGRLYDVSAVSLPANEDTQISARNRTECVLCADGRRAGPPCRGERERLALAAAAAAAM